MADKEIILRGLENLKTKLNNASGGILQKYKETIGVLDENNKQ